jgi:hypothetical protein
MVNFIRVVNNFFHLYNWIFTSKHTLYFTPENVSKDKTFSAKLKILLSYAYFVHFKRVVFIEPNLDRIIYRAET